MNNWYLCYHQATQHPDQALLLDHEGREFRPDGYHPIGIYRDTAPVRPCDTAVVLPRESRRVQDDEGNLCIMLPAGYQVCDAHETLSLESEGATNA